MNGTSTPYPAGPGGGDLLLGGPLGLIREASAAGGAASVPGGGESHLVQVTITHEADEDAAGVVIPGNTRDHGYFRAGVRAGRSGFPGLLVRLGLLALKGRGITRGGRDESQLGIGRQASAGVRLGIARGGGLCLVPGVSRCGCGPGPGRCGCGCGPGRCGGFRCGGSVGGPGWSGGGPGWSGGGPGWSGGGRRRGWDRIVAPLPYTGRRCLAARGERGRRRGRRGPGSRGRLRSRQVSRPGTDRTGLTWR